MNITYIYMLYMYVYVKHEDKAKDANTQQASQACGFPARSLGEVCFSLLAPTLTYMTPQTAKG